MIAASFILGVSFILGCMFLEKYEVPNKEQSDITISAEKPLLTIEEAADYMQLSVNEIKQIIHSEQIQLTTAGSFSGVMFPYIKISEKFYISKNELMVWINETSRERREYAAGTVIQ
ncbi:helix-turn-helix domain-containing protein [Paenibacillus sp. MCAF9]|uniref:helix-turn-helix domain-containing protein n=1 Tax=Paenibacillus sp. TAF43_2 TaxID=3233069 RepID=UPI003F9CDBDB